MIKLPLPKIELPTNGAGRFGIPERDHHLGMTHIAVGKDDVAALEAECVALRRVVEAVAAIQIQIEPLNALMEAIDALPKEAT